MHPNPRKHALEKRDITNRRIGKSKDRKEPKRYNIVSNRDESFLLAECSLSVQTEPIDYRHKILALFTHD